MWVFWIEKMKCNCYQLQNAHFVTVTVTVTAAESHKFLPIYLLSIYICDFKQFFISIFSNSGFYSELLRTTNYSQRSSHNNWALIFENVCLHLKFWNHCRRSALWNAFGKTGLRSSLSSQVWAQTQNDLKSWDLLKCTSVELRNF